MQRNTVDSQAEAAAAEQFRPMFLVHQGDPGEQRADSRTRNEDRFNFIFKMKITDHARFFRE